MSNLATALVAFASFWLGAWVGYYAGKAIRKQQ